MPIARKSKENNYTVVDNYFIDDINLKPEGKGYLLFMLSKPDYWKFNYKYLTKALGVGVKSLRSNLKNLEALKYIKRERIRDDKGRYEWIYTIYEKPYDMALKNENEPYYPRRHMDKRQMDEGNIYINTDSSNTIKNIDKEDKDKYLKNLSFFDASEHNRLTIELIKQKYIDEEDSQLYYYDDLFSNLLSEGNSYRQLLVVVQYTTSRVIERNFIDENGYEIKNKFGYLKNSIYSNLNKLNNQPENLYDDDEYDWLNDEKDYEL